MISIKFPKVLDDIFETRFPSEKYDIYYIYTLNINNPSRFTNYKKIWKLGGFDRSGLYDNYYDEKDNRIYFGITKSLPQFKSSVWMGSISILMPKEDNLPFERIFNVFSKNKYNICSDKEKHDHVLSYLQETIKNVISLIKYPQKKLVSIFMEIILTKNLTYQNYHHKIL